MAFVPQSTRKTPNTPAQLNARQEAFAQALANGDSHRSAYRSAGYSETPGSGSATVLAHNPRIVARVEAIRAQREQIEILAIEAAAAELKIDKKRVLSEYARIAFSDITKLVMWDEREAMLIDSALVNPELSPAIASVRSRNGVVEVKMHDKIAALTALAKHLGLLKRELVLSGNLEVEVTDTSSAKAMLLDRIGTIRKRLTEANDNNDADAQPPARGLTG